MFSIYSQERVDIHRILFNFFFVFNSYDHYHRQKNRTEQKNLQFQCPCVLFIDSQTDRQTTIMVIRIIILIIIYRRVLVCFFFVKMHKRRPGYIIIPVVVIVMIQSDQQRLEIEQNKQKNNYNEVKIGENFSIS